jgi:hypothetical protein
MSAEAFLDTNVFVYCFDPSEPGKQRRALELVESALRDGVALISTQVMQEFLNVAHANSRQRSLATISGCIWTGCSLPFAGSSPTRRSTASLWTFAMRQASAFTTL